MVIVETQGHSGGIAFLWRNKDEVNLNSYSKNHIDLTIHNKPGQLYRVTGVYGEPDRRKRSETWNLLRTLAMDNNLPWCLIGDFNNVVSQNDKKCGRPYPHNLVQGFRDVLEECQLIDMDLQGHQYTWERGLGTSQWIEVCLDRALVNISFQAMFEVAKLINLEISTSDHCPILLALQDNNYIARTQRFKFENARLREPMCQQIVAEVWAEHEHLSLFDKLKECSNILSAWGQEITGNFKQRIKSCKRILKALKGRRDDSSVELIKQEQRKLSEIYAQQEVFWRQRSEQLWLREGDSKTSQTEWEEVTNCMENKLNADHNVMLLKPVEEFEVKEALFHMHPDKSPGPDGITPGFYQKFWHIVKEDVVKTVQKFFEDGKIDNHLVATNIALIPKKRHPQAMTDIRPISLCNVLYKVISKVLANRLKKLIDGLISATQIAFIPGRLITDNVMVAHELMHFLNRKSKGKQSWMALKIDMSKTYDRVEWSYLAAVLEKMGFDQKVITLVMSCISSVEYRLSHAGRMFGSITPSRGIRQGDPLSSYLFLLCIEGFSSLIQKYESRKLIQGIKVAQKAPSISHILFADDCYVFCKASMDSATHILEMLYPNRYSYAFVVRDHQGALVEARLWCYEGQTSSTLAEAMGIREALSWIKTTRQQNVEVETDSLQIVQWIRSSYNSLSYVGRLVSECKELLAELHSQNVMLRFVKRSANRVAHFLARHSYLPANRIWRLDNIHPDFYHVLCDDLK
ncbi:uncharacterized protein LOC141680216 [Apium graveolens]|uniref:uncharacterized protein LOC141680216 n=1 Tax=Apium graveolens TaxID=4045 RepID=UPI003D7B5DD3